MRQRSQTRSVELWSGAEERNGSRNEGTNLRRRSSVDDLNNFAAQLCAVGAMGNPKSTVSIAGHPIHPMLVPFPIAFFVATVACDLMFYRSVDTMWVTATVWLLGAGVIMALLAALAGFTDFLGDSRIRALSVAWWHLLGNLTLVLVEAFNWYRRYQFGPDAVLPTGLALSVIAVLILLVTGWLGWEMVYRRHVGISDAEIG